MVYFFVYALLVILSGGYVVRDQYLRRERARLRRDSERHVLAQIEYVEIRVRQPNGILMRKMLYEQDARLWYDRFIFRRPEVDGLKIRWVEAKYEEAKEMKWR